MILRRTSCLPILVDDEIKQKEWFIHMVKFLQRKELIYGSKTEEYSIKKYYIFNKETNILKVPRFFPIETPDVEKIVDQPSVGKDIEIPSKIKLRNKKQEEASEWMQKNDNGILCMAPGEGKTVVAIDAICKIKKKAIIYVHKDALVEQWYHRFLEHTDIDISKICILRAANYKTDLLEKDVVITTTQGMCSLIRTKPDIEEILRDAEFGVGIWDECHTCAGAEQYSKTAILTPCKKVFGLSATPKRSDGNTDIMEYNLGKIYIPDSTDSSTMIPHIIQIKFDHQIIKNKEAYVYRKTKYDQIQKYKEEFDRDRYLGLLTNTKVSCFIQVLSKVIAQVSTSERILILLADRIKILDELSKACKNKDEVGFFIPRSGKKRDAELTKRLVFSTYGSCRDGVDKKEVDCLILATPTGNWEQAIGRGIRSCEGKKQPIIIDVVDLGLDSFVRWADSRKQHYESKGWIVEERIIKVGK